MRKLERSFDWLRNALLLSPARTPPLVTPDAMQLVVDLFGTERYLEVIREANAGASTSVNLSSTVADGEVWWLIAADASHNDAAAHSIGLGLQRVTDTATVAITDQVSKATNIRVNLSRSLYVPPGYRVICFADAVGAGVLTGQAFYIKLPIGEYSR